MLAECQLKPILIYFSFPRNGGGLCGRHGAGLDWPEEKDKFSGNLCSTFFVTINITSDLCC